MMTMNTIIRSYSELSRLRTFDERFNYLSVRSKIGVETFGGNRWLNQHLYSSSEWKTLRRKVIQRDGGYDLGIREDEREINGNIVIHHMNPITVEDVLSGSKYVWDMNYLISVSDLTHRGIHYGDVNLAKINDMVERQPNDTCPWK